MMSSLFILSLPLNLHNDSSTTSLLPSLSRNHLNRLPRFYSFRPLNQFPKSLSFDAPAQNPYRSRWHNCICFCSGEESEQKENGFDWPILRRWDVPWKWQAVSLTSLACGLSFVLTGLIETAAIPYLGIHVEELSSDEKAELLFVDQAIATAAVLAVLFGLTSSFGPRPEDVFRYGNGCLMNFIIYLTVSGFVLSYVGSTRIGGFILVIICHTCISDWRKPLDLQTGWLLWAAIGFVGAVIAVALTGVAVSFFSGETPERETDALVRLLPLIGSSSISTACLVGITGVLAPLLEETVFRGFLMVYLSKWLPTPTSIVISATVFALAHLTPGNLPQLFVLGTVLGLSYAQTRNLLTPIMIHSLWNSGVILLLTFLELQGYDIKELIQQS